MTLRDATKTNALKERFQQEKEVQRQKDDQVKKEDLRATNEESIHVQNILREISVKFRDQIARAGLTIPQQLSMDIRQTVVQLCDKIDDPSLNDDIYTHKKRIERLVMANILGLGAITPYMDDPEITEIVVQRWDNIVIERKGKIEKVDASFMSEEHLKNIINRIVQPVGRSINIQVPLVDARLPDGSRVNATIPPISPDGATLTIRKFSKDALTGQDYIKLGSLSPEMLAFLAKCVEGRCAMVVIGGTGTGKTTALNMLSSYIPKDELIVTVEDSCELQLHQPNVRRMEARGSTQLGQNENINAVTIQDLVRNALRMRPDRLIVGEIRDHTIVDMMSAMSTGHDGSMSTIHANSPENLVNSRLPILYGMNTKASFTPTSQAIQIVEALQLIVCLEHLRDGRRVFTNITHVVGLDERDRVMLEDIFVFDKVANKHKWTGYVPEAILKRLRDRNVVMPDNVFRKEDV